MELESVVARRSSKRPVKTMLVPGFCDILDCASDVYALSDTQMSGLY